MGGELALNFRPATKPDLTQNLLATAYTKFTLPTVEDGFSEVRYGWFEESKAAEHLTKWIEHKKSTLRVDDIVPSEFFNGKLAVFAKQVIEWKKLQQAFKNPAKKADKDATAEEAPIDPEDIEPLEVEDVCNIGGGRPLFAEFAFEDWTLVGLGYELHLLVTAFANDIGDAERTYFPEEHLAFYYKKYFRKEINLDDYNFSAMSKLFDVLSECIDYTKRGDCTVVQRKLEADAPLDQFIKITEENRRAREHRVDAGDESAQLTFKRVTQVSTAAKRPVPPPPSNGKPQPPAYPPAKRPANATNYVPSYGKGGAGYAYPSGQKGYPAYGKGGHYR